LLAVTVLGPGQAAPLAPLFVIPVEVSAKDPVPDDAPLRVNLTSHDAAALATKLGVKLAAGASSFEYLIGAYPQLQASDKRTWLEPTFLIDFDEPVFKELEKELTPLIGTATPQALVKYVSGAMDSSKPRGWDIASLVAKKRQGDCSEHAVFVAALARMYGMPARVTVGVAIMSQGTTHGAFGHAWAEVLEDGRWKIADAALYSSQVAVRYIPIGLIEEEGMGYSISLMATTKMWLQKVEVLGAGTR
jgi:transglutaminase-like putative cysteine protease